MTQNRIMTAVFSYNRPLHLENCLQSLAKLYPGAEVHVFDDNSSDTRVDEVLSRFACTVHKGRGGSGRHGGLYDNMQMAFDHALADGFEYLLCIQDDMQLVRPFDQRMQGHYFDAFEQNDRLTQIDIRFARGERGQKLVQPVPDMDAPQAFVSYLDVGLCAVNRMQALGWSFEIDRHIVVSGEQTLSLRAAELGMQRAVTFWPFAMHVPFPALYRNRFRLPRLSGVSKKIFRFEYMTDAQIKAMDARDPDLAAHWRDYLTVADTNFFDRWLLSGKNDAKIIA